jgi:hypothetical protein
VEQLHSELVDLAKAQNRSENGTSIPATFLRVMAYPVEAVDKPVVPGATERWLSVDELAEYLGIKRDTV